MATGFASTSSFSAREKTNFTRLSRLLIEVGRRVLQDVFDSMHPPSALHAVLNSIPVKKQLRRLQFRKVLHTQQWNLLYPTSGIAQSKDFDITLLFLLLRNFCGLRMPSRGWDSEPTPTNLTMEDDLVRIKLCRNMLYAHRVELALTDDEFESYWDKIEAALNRLGRSKYRAQIEHLKFSSMDHQTDTSFYALLQSWEEMQYNANSGEQTRIINGTIKILMAGGTILVWSAGSAYFLMRYREDPEAVIRLVQEAIVPSGLATSAIVYALLPGSFKVLIEINPDALDYISRSLNDGSLEKNLENVIITDELCRLAPDGTKKVLLSVTFEAFQDLMSVLGAKMSDRTKVSLQEKLVLHMPYEGHIRLAVLLSPETINGNNYKLLAEKLGFTTEEIRNLETKDEPVLELFKDRRCLDLTIACLKSKLLEMERLDVIDDLKTYEEETPTPSEYERMYAERAKARIEEFGDLTVLPGDKKYDAFICYCKRDVLFAKELLSKLEAKPYHLKLCIDYRDILPGGEKLSTVVNVIEERCRKVIVIISKHFSEDVDADFQAKIALSLSPGCKEKRLIPIVYDNRKHVPAILKHITHLDYTNKIAREYFWPNLARSLGYKD